MSQLTILDPIEQRPLAGEPYDRWVSPEGQCIAEFYRQKSNYLMRFQDEADFLIDPEAAEITASPAIGVSAQHVRKLFGNSVVPTLGNHNGGIFLHGSSVATEYGAIAFLGVSRGGKTTLAAAFAKGGYPLLTEDVIDLERAGDSYEVRPKSSPLRLFHDSANHLFGSRIGAGIDDEKVAVDASDDLIFATEPAPLAAIFALGNDHEAKLEVNRLTAGKAVSTLMQHAFVLDVEDRGRMRAHFERLADLSLQVPVHSLDYTRDYSTLPQVQSAILTAVRG